MDNVLELLKGIIRFMEGRLESELDSEFEYDSYDTKNNNTNNSRIERIVSTNPYPVSYYGEYHYRLGIPNSS